MRRPYRYPNEVICLAIQYGCMYTGWTATSGHNAFVLWMITCESSHGSIRLLSEYTRMPVQPYSSLQRAMSATRDRYCCCATPVEGGHVEKTSTVVSEII